MEKMTLKPVLLIACAFVLVIEAGKIPNVGIVKEVRKRADAGLVNGCNGIWASIIIERTVMGNASSCVALMNMIRLGNTKVLSLRQSAIKVRQLTTSNKLYIKQPVYGERALDIVLDMAKGEFDMAKSFGEHAPVRITTLASPEMIKTRLVNVFGDDPQFTNDLAYNLKEVMLEDLRNNSENLNKSHQQNLQAEIRQRWDTWVLKGKDQGDNKLQFDSFYNGFMAPYFSCYRCSETLKAFKVLDMDSDGYIDWNEFNIYLTWTVRQHPDCKNADCILDIALRNDLISVVHDQLLARQ